MRGAVAAGGARTVQNVLDKYQKDRLAFTQVVANLALRESNMEALQTSGIISLLRPLLADTVPSIQQCAALALGRLANHNEEVAEAIIASKILPQLVFSLSEQNRFYKKAAAFVVRAIAKHSPHLAKATVDAGALTALTNCLEDFDPTVKESTAWAIGYIARHNAELAHAVQEAGAIPLLVLCIQEPELSLRRIAASALSDIAKHSPELAQAVVDANVIPLLAPLVNTQDNKLRRQVCAALAQIAKHTVDLAENVVEADIFPTVFTALRSPDLHVRRNAATLICEITKHTVELAQLVVNSGGIAAVVAYVSESEGPAQLPAIMTLGYVAAFLETLALAVIVAKGVPALMDALDDRHPDYIRAAAAWALGQIGRHNSEHAKVLCDAAVIPKMLHLAIATSPAAAAAAGLPSAGLSAEQSDLHTKAKRALKAILEKTLDIAALDPVLQLSTPPNILKHIVHQIAKVLPHNVVARRAFVTSGGLQRIQEISHAYAKDAHGAVLAEFITAINACYPEEIIRYYSPGYTATLLNKLDDVANLAANEGPAAVVS
ncbi:hypothetical protein CXG81DRAFT_29488 [Caulochytrium protostelioides]|uniref:Sperm-associated antigen 6 n=1 Tax=Caulochytrium protostelioides TaxID=1555241 RepID=A0A4P9XAW2_9FUNG|nr:hypothetical protein CXG81DRAFT_29488 [Caulochytrium protostelioides]|eukprot:RKP02524.1 hypothetical protein CXG81DRAFT_29488 [Caulochytrium protostelioides]